MDVLSQLLLLLFRSLVVILPLTVGWLAFRRLALSASPNAWLYAVTCLFATATTAGLLPWALGVSRVNGLFFVFSVFAPAIWVGVVMLCDIKRQNRPYERDLLVETVLKLRPDAKPTPLVLENPDIPGTPVPIFRHNVPAPAAAPQETDRDVLSVAREMRGNSSSDARRPRLLPPPDIGELPFLRGTGAG